MIEKGTSKVFWILKYGGIIFGMEGSIKRVYVLNSNFDFKNNIIFLKIWLRKFKGVVCIVVILG